MARNWLWVKYRNNMDGWRNHRDNFYGWKHWQTWEQPSGTTGVVHFTASPPMRSRCRHSRVSRTRTVITRRLPMNAPTGPAARPGSTVTSAGIASGAKVTLSRNWLPNSGPPSCAPIWSLLLNLAKITHPISQPGCKCWLLTTERSSPPRHTHNVPPNLSTAGPRRPPRKSPRLARHDVGADTSADIKNPRRMARHRRLAQWHAPVPRSFHRHNRRHTVQL